MQEDGFAPLLDKSYSFVESPTAATAADTQATAATTAVESSGLFVVVPVPITGSRDQLRSGSPGSLSDAGVCMQQH